MLELEHPPITAEEVARRDRIRELRLKILGLAQHRRLIKAAYRLPHQSPQYLARLKELRALLGIPEDAMARWAPHAIPGRSLYREALTRLHVELAGLRGRVHIQSKPLTS